MAKTFLLNLQLFAGEGGGAAGGTGASAGGEGGGEGAPTGDNGAVAAEQQRLRELGVPESKLRKRAQRASARLPEGAVKSSAPKEEESAPKAEEQVAAAENPTEETVTAPTRMSWDEIMADPEYNRQMQSVVQSRLRSAKEAEGNLAKLTPALELLARKHGMNTENMDYDALAKAISEDDAYYEDKALEMGVSVETAKKIDQQEREAGRQQREAERTLEQQRIQQHIQSLEQQGEAMKKIFPSFDLRKELQNPAFARMTSPSGGVSVEAAYYAVHHQELQTAAMQETAKRTAQNISNAIRSGSHRPDENGISGQAPSVTTFDYRNASAEQRNALKKRIRDAAARGEKLYPGK